MINHCRNYKNNVLLSYHVGKQNANNLNCIPHHSTANFFRHPKPHNFVHHCSCWAVLYPMSALKPCHLFIKAETMNAKT